MKLVPYIYNILGRRSNTNKVKRLKKEKVHRPETLVSANQNFENQNIEEVEHLHQKHIQHDQNKHEEAIDHYESLKDAVTAVNDELSQYNSKYKFSIYMESGEVYISLLQLNDSGHITKMQKKNITHQEFNDWIRHIEKGEGFFLDTLG